MQNQIINLEMKFAFQEKTIDELNTVIIDQQRKIDHMQMQIAELFNRLKSQTQTDNEITNPRPPHH